MRFFTLPQKPQMPSGDFSLHYNGRIAIAHTAYGNPNSRLYPQDLAWDALTPEQQQGFAPICPDFVMAKFIIQPTAPRLLRLTPWKPFPLPSHFQGKWSYQGLR